MNQFAVGAKVRASEVFKEMALIAKCHQHLLNRDFQESRELLMVTFDRCVDDPSMTKQGNQNIAS